MKNRLLIIVNDNNTSIYEIIEQLSNMYKIVVPRKETTDESLAFYSSFFNLLSTSEFDSLINDVDPKVKAFAHTDKGSIGYKTSSVGQGYADLYNGKGRVLLLSIGKEELPFYSHFYNSATYIGFANSNEEADNYRELLDEVVVNNEESLEQLSKVIEKVITLNPYVYEKNNCF